MIRRTFCRDSSGSKARISSIRSSNSTRTNAMPSIIDAIQRNDYSTLVQLSEALDFTVGYVVKYTVLLPHSYV